MIFFWDIITAWLAVGLAILLSVIWVLRIWIKKRRRGQSEEVYRWNRRLRKSHKWLGIAFVVVGLIHGALSTMEVLSPNKGTLITLLGLMMGLTYLMRRWFKRGNSWMRIHRVLTVLVLLLIPAHIVEVGGISGIDGLKVALLGSETLVLTEIDQPDLSLNVYDDGTYTGVATGFRSGLTVEVTLEDSMIASVEVISHNEVGQRFYGKAIDAVPVEIVESQSLDVDTVSGATYTSVGIVNAVAEALNDALVSGEEMVLTELELVAEGGHFHDKKRGIEIPETTDE